MSEKMRPAFIMIDMQGGFIDKDSPLCIKYAADTVDDCAFALDVCRGADIPIFHVNRIYREDGTDVEKARYAVWAAGGKPLTPGSESAKPPVKLAPQGDEYVIIKPRYSAFFQTSLDLVLRRLGVDTIVLAGTTTPNCIRSTFYDGASMDYDVIVLTDCCSSNTEEIQRVNMEDMQRAGAKLMTSREFAELIK